MKQRLALVVSLPVSPIERLAGAFRNHLHLPDPAPLYALMGTVAANMIEGTPVWLMMVGPPSCGKSELLNSLLDMPHMIEGADIAGEAAFLSGSAKREVARDATGGLLRQVGEHGGLVLNDFTSVLSKAPEKISTVMAVFRECFGGRWTRHVGVDGGRALTWTGKLALFAGCTGKIDQHHQISAELGERWVYYRFDERDVFADTMMALSNGRNGWRDDLRAAVNRFFDDLGLQFGTPQTRRAFSNAERVRLYELASLAARCRSGVVRDNYSKEIVDARESELAIRLSTVLAQLLVGLDFIGVQDRTAWRLLAKIAMDSMPRLRKLTVETVARSAPTVEDLRKQLGCSLSVAKRVVEDLEVHEVVLRENTRLYLTPWMRERYSRFCK